MIPYLSYTVPPGRRVVLLTLLFIAGLCVSGVLAGLLISISSAPRLLAMTRIATIIQDIFMLVVPAVLAAVIVTRRPARLLCLDTTPGVMTYIAAIAAMLLFSPLMSVIVEWNASLHLPASMSGLEAALREMEAKAGGAVEFMLGPATAGNLVMSLLIVALMAGFSEELFFRGALQRILAGTRLSPVAALWIAAFIFSAIHMQPFGFVPRLLLGAYFGYLLVWTGSVWVPMAAHVTNNALYVAMRYATGSGEPELGGAELPAIVAGTVLSALLIYYLYRNRIIHSYEN